MTQAFHSVVEAESMMDVHMTWRGWLRWEHEGAKHPFVQQRTGIATFGTSHQRPMLSVRCTHPNCMPHGAEMWSWGDDSSYRVWMLKHWHHQAFHGVQVSMRFFSDWWPDAA